MMKTLLVQGEVRKINELIGMFAEFGVKVVEVKKGHNIDVVTPFEKSIKECEKTKLKKAKSFKELRSKADV